MPNLKELALKAIADNSGKLLDGFDDHWAGGLASTVVKSVAADDIAAIPHFAHDWADQHLDVAGQIRTSSLTHRSAIRGTPWLYHRNGVMVLDGLCRMAWQASRALV